MQKCLHIMTGLLVVAGAAPTASATFLLDNGRGLAANGAIAVAVTGADQAFGGFTQFQRFVVPAGQRWRVDEVGLNAYTAQDPGVFGFTGSILPEVNGQPAAGPALGSGNWITPELGLPAQLPADQDWTYVNFGGLVLEPGAYWLRAEAVSIFYNGGILYGATGDAAFGVRGVDNGIVPHEPISLRIVGQDVIPEPAFASVFVLAAGLARRRR